MLGYEQQELLGRHFSILVHPDDREDRANSDRENLQRLRSGEVEYFASESRYAHKDGHPVGSARSSRHSPVKQASRIMSFL